MSITSTVSMTVDYKIETIEISVPQRTIVLKIRKTVKAGDVMTSNSLFSVVVQGDAFTAMSNSTPDGTKDLYHAISDVAYAYCVANNKLN